LFLDIYGKDSTVDCTESLEAFIHHHMTTLEALPCRLRLPATPLSKETSEVSNNAAKDIS